ncbi:glycosyltransferase family 2 protein [Candidatus Parvarchaeota archaeon]|nr:glycosyltransferase family 2 protein [Candidatus Parvarchaeota archaeon]
MLSLSDLFTSSIVFVLLVLSIFWILYFFDIKHEIKKEEEKELKLNEFPSVAVLIPAIYEGKRLRETIENVKQTSYPNYNIYVVLNKSSTKETVKAAAAKGVKVIKAPFDGKARVMNYAIKNYINEKLLLVLDADTFIEKDLMTRLVYHFKNKKVAAVVSSVKVYKPKKVVEYLQYYEYLLSILARKALSKIGGLVIIHGAGSMFNTEILKKIGYFDDNNYSEDMEIGMRILTNGYRVESSIKAISYTVVPNTLRKLFRQRERWFSGFFFNVLKYRKTALDSKRNDVWKIALPFMLVSIFLSFFVIIGITYTVVVFLLPAYGILSNTSLSFFTSYFLPQLSFLTLNSRIFLELVGAGIGIFSIIYSLLTIDHKFKAVKDFFGILGYMTFYSFFLSFVWLYSLSALGKFRTGKLIWLPNISD